MLGMLLVAAAPLGLQAESLGTIADRLSAATPYHATARYEVLLPQSEEPVAYEVALNAVVPEKPDTLAPCDYLIDWTIATPSGPSHGFSAYFDGHHYRFRDKRLQEYHYDDSPAPFEAHGTVRLGVQQQAQFASLLPAFLAERMREIEADSSYTYNIDETPSSLKVQGVQRFGGVDGLEFRYVFDAADGRPVSAEFCHNPGQMSEQTVSVRYSGPDLATMDATFTEPTLMAIYPEAFGRYRESSYTLDNLPGRPLPEVSAPTIGGERYLRRSGEPFGTPAVVALLDADVDGCAETVSLLRRAMTESPRQGILILAFVSNHPDAVAEAIGSPMAGEVALTGARGLARACGATATPVVIVCSSDGTVQNVHTGRNKELHSIVMQEMIIAK